MLKRSERLPRVYWLQAEELEVEYLLFPETDFLWDKKFPLEEGELFLQFWLSLDADYPYDALWHRDTEKMTRVYDAWRKSRGYVSEDELKETVNELQKQVKSLMKALSITLQEAGDDVELEAELAELRAERAMQ